MFWSLKPALTAACSGGLALARTRPRGGPLAPAGPPAARRVGGPGAADARDARPPRAPRRGAAGPAARSAPRDTAGYGVVSKQCRRQSVRCQNVS